MIKRVIPYVIRKDTKFILSLSYHSILYVGEKVHLILYHASSCVKRIYSYSACSNFLNFRTSRIAQNNNNNHLDVCFDVVFGIASSSQQTYILEQKAWRGSLCRLLLQALTGVMCGHNTVACGTLCNLKGTYYKSFSFKLNPQLVAIMFLLRYYITQSRVTFNSQQQTLFNSQWNLRIEVSSYICGST